MKVLQVQTLLTYEGDYPNPHCSVRREKPRVSSGRDQSKPTRKLFAPAWNRLERV